MPPAVGCAAGFGVYLVAAAGLSALSPGSGVGIAVLLVIAATMGWWTSVPAAVLVGLLGWPFYSGFVTHSEGVLAVTGPKDAVIAGMLVLVAVAAALVHNAVGRAQVPVEDPDPVDIPVQRRALEQLQHH
jgi:hypothetical protein